MSAEHEEDEPESEEAGPSIDQAALIRSYLAYVGRAVRKRRLKLGLVFLGLASLIAGVVAILPPNYHCEMKLTALRNQVLEDDTRANLLGNARELLVRRDNLIALAKRADLVARWDADRAPVLRLKDRIMARLRGEIADADKLNAIVYRLEGSLSVYADDITLTIGVDWPGAATAARIVDAAEQSFLEARHNEEISTIQERISILEQHASALREEIDTIAEQLQRLREEKLAQADKILNKDQGPEAATSAQPAAIPRRPSRILAASDEDLPRLKAELEAKKKSIVDLEADRSRRLVEAEARLADMRIKFTPAHPAALAAEQTIAGLSHESAQVTSLRSAVEQLESEVKSRSANTGERTGGGGGGSSPTSSAKADVLPSDIMKLLDSGTGIDPTVSAHLGSAVGEYAQLHDVIRGKRIALDNAQAAFNHRYQILTPVEVPGKPVKSKGPIILAGGWAGALLFLLLAAIVAELRTGVVVERWQVVQMQLPILAELRFPGSSSE